MLLKELLDISDREIRSIENTLDDFIYRPPHKVKADDDAIDLAIPTGHSHFMDRLHQRAQAANIKPKEIQDLFKKARLRPDMGAKAIDKMSRADITQPQNMTLHDPDTDLVIPVVFVPNKECKLSRSGESVCSTGTGRAPKNSMIAKTIYRKGIQD